MTAEIRDLQPPAPRPVLTVVSNADERFFPGLAVAVSSAVAAASGRCDYRFLILDGGLPEAGMERLAAQVGRLGAERGIAASVAPLAVDQSRLSALPARRGSRMTYAKLVLPEMLSGLDSIVYLDADVLCFAGVEEVHPPAGEGGFLLAGARDYFAVIEKDCPWLDQVPVAERQLPYINCGVMQMNLAGLRAMNFTELAIRARAAVGEARQGDQSVFNFLCRGRSFLLPSRLNHRTGLGSNAPLLRGELDLNIHYIGSPKPWLGEPRTANWLAHRLWHQAAAALFPADMRDESGARPLPADRGKVLRKGLLYSLLNPSRGAYYRSDLQSLKDPAGALARAAAHWRDGSPV